MINRLIPALILPIILLPSSAVADAISISFASSLLTLVPGQTATFSATLTNTTSMIEYLNGDVANIAAPLLVDDLKFFLNFPMFLTPSQIVSAAIFDVPVPTSGAPNGLYTGSFEILGGPDITSLASLGSANFAVNVVPEPRDSVALLTSAVGLLWFWKRKRGRN